MDTDMKPLQFIGEPIQVGFNQKPTLEKRPSCPDRFGWRGKTYSIVEKLSEWHDYSHKSRMAHNMRAEHAATAKRHGSWGIGRDFYRVRTNTNQIFDLYYGRAPKNIAIRKGAWSLFREMSEEGTEHGC
jgi:hypothetical protein